MLMRKCKFTLPMLAEDGGTGSGDRTQSLTAMSKLNRLTTTTTTLLRPRRGQHIRLHRPTQIPGRWEKTKSSMHSTKLASAATSLQASSEPNITKRPSYLLPLSYPSDPQCSPSTPLALSGTFTNSHFRTLHIIYRKSLKFHAPAVGTIRPEIMALKGLKIEIDESGNGVERGVF